MRFLRVRRPLPRAEQRLVTRPLAYADLSLALHHASGAWPGPSNQHCGYRRLTGCGEPATLDRRQLSVRGCS